MPSELDPLLPHNDASPEIIRSGDGHAKAVAKDRDSEKLPDQTPTLSLRNLLAILTLVVGIAVIITAGTCFTGRGSLPSPTVPPGKSKGRVKDILSTNPLIGKRLMRKYHYGILFLK